MGRRLSVSFLLLVRILCEWTARSRTDASLRGAVLQCCPRALLATPTSSDRYLPRPVRDKPTRTYRVRTSRQGLDGGWGGRSGIEYGRSRCSPGSVGGLRTMDGYSFWFYPSLLFELGACGMLGLRTPETRTEFLVYLVALFLVSLPPLISDTPESWTFEQVQVLRTRPACSTQVRSRGHRGRT